MNLCIKIKSKDITYKKERKKEKIVHFPIGETKGHEVLFGFKPQTLDVGALETSLE